LIEEQHQQILRLLEALVGEPVAGPPPPAERKKVATWLIMEAARHEVAEEQHLWPEVVRLLESGPDLAQRGLQQESTGKRMLHDLDHMQPGNEEFDTLIRQVASELHTHVTYEESVILPGLRLKLSTEEAAEIGSRYQRDHEAGPTRPHPHTPPDPRLLKVTGRGIATVDRARDRVTGRGR
jgi:hemerythrin-like domain-containing protein